MCINQKDYIIILLHSILQAGGVSNEKGGDEGGRECRQREW